MPLDIEQSQMYPLTGNCSCHLFRRSKKATCKTNILRLAVQRAHDESDKLEIPNSETTDCSELDDRKHVRELYLELNHMNHHLPRGHNSVYPD